MTRKTGYKDVVVTAYMDPEYNKVTCRWAVYD